MLIALDTSVLVAGALEGHPFHARAWIWHQALDGGDVQGSLGPCTTRFTLSKPNAQAPTCC